MIGYLTRTNSPNGLTLHVRCQTSRQRSVDITGHTINKFCLVTTSLFIQFYEKTRKVCMMDSCQGSLSIIRPEHHAMGTGRQGSPLDPKMGPQTDVAALGSRYGGFSSYNVKSPKQTYPSSGMLGFNRSRSHYSLSASSTSSGDSSSVDKTITSSPPVLQYATDRDRKFGAVLREQTGGSPDTPQMDRRLREALEPHLATARLLREKARNHTHFEVHSSIASSVGVPYTKLRSERPFLYDDHTYPIHEILAETLGVPDLSRLHEESGDLSRLLSPLLNRQSRRKFQETYDSFVTSFCIPLLHSLAMSKCLLAPRSGGYSSNFICYRYQAFPTIRVSRPGDPLSASGPRCDTSTGHSIGCLQFHIPLTPSFGTNALYTESYPGREDWHPLVTRSVGLGFLFDGARCLHYNMENTTDTTCVSLNFRIAIYRESEDDYEHVDGCGLCTKDILDDSFSRAGPGYYDEAAIDVGVGSPAWQIVAKKHGNQLLDPDYRVGFPFA